MCWDFGCLFALMNGYHPKFQNMKILTSSQQVFSICCVFVSIQGTCIIWLQSTFMSFTTDWSEPDKSIIVSTLHITRTPTASGSDRISLATFIASATWLLVWKNKGAEGSEMNHQQQQLLVFFAALQVYEVNASCSSPQLCFLIPRAGPNSLCSLRKCWVLKLLKLTFHVMWQTFLDTFAQFWRLIDFKWVGTSNQEQTLELVSQMLNITMHSPIWVAKEVAVLQGYVKKMNYLNPTSESEFPLFLFKFLELAIANSSSATLTAFTEARGDDNGALNRVPRVGRKASSTSSWLSLQRKKRI